MFVFYIPIALRYHLYVHLTSDSKWLPLAEMGIVCYRAGLIYRRCWLLVCMVRRMLGFLFYLFFSPSPIKRSSLFSRIYIDVMVGGPTTGPQPFFHCHSALMSTLCLILQRWGCTIAPLG